MWRFSLWARHLAQYRDDDTGMTLLHIGDAVAHGTWDTGPRLYEEAWDDHRGQRFGERMEPGGGYGD